MLKWVAVQQVPVLNRDRTSPAAPDIQMQRSPRFAPATIRTIAELVGDFPLTPLGTVTTTNSAPTDGVTLAQIDTLITTPTATRSMSRMRPRELT